MFPERIFGTAVVAAFLLTFIDKLFPKPRSKEKYFKCARCRATSRHTERTIEAWRNKKTNFSVKHAIPNGLKTNHSEHVSNFHLIGAMMPLPVVLV